MTIEIKNPEKGKSLILFKKFENITCKFRKRLLLPPLGLLELPMTLQRMPDVLMIVRGIFSA